MKPIPTALALAIALGAPAAGATKDGELPDKELLKMIEFLREMEIVKQIDMMRDLHHVESVGEQAKNSAPQKSAPVKKKETSK